MARVCRYCEEEKTTGDCNKTILESDLKINGYSFIGHQIFIDGNQLVLFVDNAESARCYSYKTRKIKYCPMCGKKLV